MSALTTAALKAALPRIATMLADSAEELNSADGRLGDGDLGITMTRGIQTVLDEAHDLPEDVGLALLQCAKAFTRISGSTYGTLLATGLMSAAKACKGRNAVGWNEIAGLAAGAVTAMQARGRAELGDKTVLDALNALSGATAGLSEPAEILDAAHAAVTRSLDEFRDRPSRQGRARMFGDKSVGLDDPGMLALLCLLDGLAS